MASSAPRHRRHLRVVPEPESARDDIVLSIDCDDCAEQHTRTCDDCVVSHVLGHGPGRRVELDGEEYRQVELLAAAGLVPGSRFVAREGS